MEKDISKLICSPHLWKRWMYQRNYNIPALVQRIEPNGLSYVFQLEDSVILQISSRDHKTTRE